MGNDNPKPEDMVGMREGARLSQTAAAALIGLSMRAYQSLEAPDGNPRQIHAQAFERGLMELAVRDGDVTVLPIATLAIALRIAELAGHPVPSDGPDPALVALEARREDILADLAPVEAALEAYRTQKSRRGNAGTG